MKIQRILNLILPLFLLVIIYSCNNEENNDEKKNVDQEFFGANRSFNTTFDGKLFSVPSPLQTALLIKSLDIPYNQTLLNNEGNIDNYNVAEKKAINLGIYSADLGYITLYNQNATSFKYVSLVESLANDLGISSAFDKSFMERFEKNISHEDSMMIIISDGLRKADNFLKENEQKNMSALILTGGWIESMYIASQLYKENGNKEVLVRISEQKQTLKTIIELLDKYNLDEQNSIYIDMFNDLDKVFSKINTSYIYVPSETNREEKITTIKSKMEIEISEELAQNLIESIANTRNQIVQ